MGKFTTMNRTVNWDDFIKDFISGGLNCSKSDRSKNVSKIKLQSFECFQNKKLVRFIHKK